MKNLTGASVSVLNSVTHARLKTALITHKGAALASKTRNTPFSGEEAK